jgi:hypothetical protein
MPLAELQIWSKEQDHECSCNKALHNFVYEYRKLKSIQRCFDMEALDENRRIRRYSDGDHITVPHLRFCYARSILGAKGLQIYFLSLIRYHLHR